MANINLQQRFLQLKDAVDRIPAKKTLPALGILATGAIACGADYVTKGIITGLVILALTVGLPMSMVFLSQELDAKKAQKDKKNKS